MNDLIKFAGIALLLGYTCQSVVLASAPPPHRATKHRFTQKEDAQLRTLVEQYGASNWWDIAEGMPGRTGKQCRERWINHLSPEINNSMWTAEEDRILLEQQALLGNQWARIALFLPGRSVAGIKNRWALLQRNGGNPPPLQQALQTLQTLQAQFALLPAASLPSQIPAVPPPSQIPAVPPPQVQFAPLPPVVAQNSDRDDPTGFDGKPLARQFDGDDPLFRQFDDVFRFDYN
ncbi:MAG: hypothetical protein LBF84_01575 [Holosporales bacterium]|jgi:hypothetical protein|nr:hypothetical protein [Holosporales bacterium]